MAGTKELVSAVAKIMVITMTMQSAVAWAAGTDPTGGAPLWLIPPSLLADDQLARLYLALLAIGAAIAVISLATQMRAPTPYGRHASREPAWGPPVRQRYSQALATALPGIGLFTWLFFVTCDSLGTRPSAASWALFAMWLAHFAHRGLLHPALMRYSSPTVPLGICLGALVPNAIFATLNALAIAAMPYPDSWLLTPWFTLGGVLFVAGWIINRRADWTLRGLRASGATTYELPRGGLFEWVSSPNYLGELVMWIGWSLATWTAAGTMWALFAAATFFPRARDHHRWYQERFPEYPEERRALIPFTW